MTYNEPKLYGGRIYTGMGVGTGHRWAYNNGVWTEIKRDADNYDIDFACCKSRRGYTRNAGRSWSDTTKWAENPQSGAAIGSKYRYAILAMQEVEKTCCSGYNTHMVGEKVITDYQKPGKKWASELYEGMKEQKAGVVMDTFERLTKRIYDNLTTPEKMAEQQMKLENEAI